MNRRIEAALRRVTQAADSAAKVIQEVQESCPHGDVAVAPYSAFRALDGGLLPLFVCAECGAWETGWSAHSFRPSRILSERECRQISRKEAYALRQGENRGDAD